MNLKKVIFILFTSLVISSCGPELKVPEDSQLFAKHIVFDENQTLKMVDTAYAEPFKKHEEYHDIFKLKNRIYASEYTFTLHPDGSLHRVYYYTGRKDPIYKKTGLNPLDINRDEIGKNFWIKLSESHSHIIDNGDTLEIEKIYPNEKLVFVKKQNNLGRITLYEYKPIYNTVKEDTPDFNK